jgi:hypothetical protein
MRQPCCHDSSRHLSWAFALDALPQPLTQATIQALARQ